MTTHNGAQEAGDLSGAAMWGDKELLESLLKSGADPDFPNAQGDTALHEAAYYGEVECASILLDHKGRGGRRGVRAVYSGWQHHGNHPSVEGRCSFSQGQTLPLVLHGQAFVKLK